MFKYFLKNFLIFSIVFQTLFLAISSAYATEITYKYDALGRLTFVEDSVNGNRDYNYDPAGNRTGLAYGTDVEDGDADPLAEPLLAPTGLSTYGPISQAGGYPSRWTAVTNAEYYIFRTVDNNEYTLTGTSITKETEADWVRACNNVSGCGPKAYF